MAASPARKKPAGKRKRIPKRAEAHGPAADASPLALDDAAIAETVAPPRITAMIVPVSVLMSTSGFDLCNLLRQDPSLRSTRVIFVTGDAFDSGVQRARRAGADAVLVKPCQPRRAAQDDADAA